jgi:hypothetical protein
MGEGKAILSACSPATPPLTLPYASRVALKHGARWDGGTGPRRPPPRGRLHPLVLHASNLTLSDLPLLHYPTLPYPALDLSPHPHTHTRTDAHGRATPRRAASQWTPGQEPDYYGAQIVKK